MVCDHSTITIAPKHPQNKTIPDPDQKQKHFTYDIIHFIYFQLLHHSDIIYLIYNQIKSQTLHHITNIVSPQMYKIAREL
jgi:hypothetical protein